MTTRAFDLICIGGGSGGLACAQRAAEYGARAAVIEYGRLGGTCVNVGCVPKKVMWNAAGIAARIEDAADYGFDVTCRAHDWTALKGKRDAYIARSGGFHVRGYLELMRCFGFKSVDGPVHPHMTEGTEQVVML